MKYFIAGLFGLLLSSHISAQAAWELGLQGGVAGYMGDLAPKSTPELDLLGQTFGLRVGVNMSDAWLIRLDLEKTSLLGDDKQFSDPAFSQNRLFSFETDIYGASLQLVWEPFGTKRYPLDGGYRKILSPYVFAGIGYISRDSRADFSQTNEGGTPQINADIAAAAEKGNVLLPFGGGLRIDISKRSSIGLEVSLRTDLSDYLDGVSESGRPGDRDWYTLGSITYSLRFPKKDYDRDGIIDVEDACPRIAGVRSAAGCPDADGDGVEDLEDVCPQLAGPLVTNGCPDADRDGVSDPEDPCIYQPGTPRSGGCPDKDNDGLADINDLCPDCPGLPEQAGCPDKDGDGVIDSQDRCPGLKGELALSGCPTAEAEAIVVDNEQINMDSVASAITIVDPKEALASLQLNEEETPVEDSLSIDTDSVSEVVTLTEKGISGDSIGVHTATEELISSRKEIEQTSVNDRAEETTVEALEKAELILAKKRRALRPAEMNTVLDLATESIRFEFAKTEIVAAGQVILKDLANIMNKYPSYKLKIEGHTDSKGSEPLNQRLSEQRAAACYLYLIKQGIPFDRMEYEGFGESRPVTSNDTDAGRARNRRVTFDLYE